MRIFKYKKINNFCTFYSLKIKTYWLQYLYKNNEYYCDLYDSYMNKYQEEEIK